MKKCIHGLESSKNMTYSETGRDFTQKHWKIFGIQIDTRLGKVFSVMIQNLSVITEATARPLIMSSVGRK